MAAGRLTLSPERPTPLGWRIRNLLHLVGVPLLFLLLSPLLLVACGRRPSFRLRRLEKTDPELCDRATRRSMAPSWRRSRITTSRNQFSAMGSLKPGFCGSLTTVFVLLVDRLRRAACLHARPLARVRTIHFARWVFLDDRKRVCSSATTTAASRATWTTSSTRSASGSTSCSATASDIRRTNWLILDGCGDERKFKEYLRRHQMPTQVWYKAYPGLTARGSRRNSAHPAGTGVGVADRRDAREWVALL